MSGEVQEGPPVSKKGLLAKIGSIFRKKDELSLPSADQKIITSQPPRNLEEVSPGAGSFSPQRLNPFSTESPQSQPSKPPSNEPSQS